MATGERMGGDGRRRGAALLVGWIVVASSAVPLPPQSDEAETRCEEKGGDGCRRGPVLLVRWLLLASSAMPLPPQSDKAGTCERKDGDGCRRDAALLVGWLLLVSSAVPPLVSEKAATGATGERTGDDGRRRGGAALILVGCWVVASIRAVPLLMTDENATVAAGERTGGDGSRRGAALILVAGDDGRWRRGGVLARLMASLLSDDDRTPTGEGADTSEDDETSMTGTARSESEELMVMVGAAARWPRREGKDGGIVGAMAGMDGSIRRWIASSFIGLEGETAALVALPPARALSFAPRPAFFFILFGGKTTRARAILTHRLAADSSPVVHPWTIYT